jgi:hypothetical protein
MENLLNIYGAQDNKESRETFEPSQRKTILEELSDILHLRGRLQQMGATFADNGELLTYGNPPSPSEFGDMIRLGPSYNEQWSAFFVSSYEPPDHGGANEQLWAGLRTLKKLLRNEGVVFGRQHQRYSFGDSSAKLRRLCCAYDELRNEWLAMLRSSLPAHGDAQLATLLEEMPSSEDDSESGDGKSQLRDTTTSQDITGRPHLLHHRSSSTPHTIGWRFSGDSTPSRRSNGNWRFSDDLSSVPVWEDVERADVEEVQIASRTVPIRETDVLEEANDRPDVGRAEASRTVVPPNLMLHGPSPLHVSHMGSRIPRSSLPTLPQTMETQSMMLNDEITTSPDRDNVLNGGFTDQIWVEGTTKDHEKGKKWGKVRRWFRYAFHRK